MKLIVVEGVSLQDLVDAEECKCEAVHEYGPPCTETVRWSRPPFPCGCVPRSLVCQAEHDWAFTDPPACTDFCGYCGRAFPLPEWRKGWYAI